MTTLAVIVAVVALWIVLTERRQRRIERRWDLERQSQDEQLAAINGRPHGNVTVLAADDDEPA